MRPAVVVVAALVGVGLFVAGLMFRPREAFAQSGVQWDDQKPAAAARPPPKSPALSPGARWQIFNGTPEMAKNIMLLDTVTGQTWILCHDSKTNADGWCNMFRESAP